MNDSRSSRNPWLFVPTMYFGEGLPYVLINTVSVILYKTMGVDNNEGLRQQNSYFWNDSAGMSAA
ncbi:MAG: hypothetical protein OEW15_05620 [Nitrospirota bacterium]|nr:hypothetical protein [Nitrospirota bacterium]